MRRTAPALLACILTAVVLFCLAGYQVTTETASTRLLSRLAAALIEVDRWLPAHHEDIELQARDRPQGLIAIADLPLELHLSAAQVLDTAGDQQALRRVIVDRMGQVLYDDGTAAFRDDEGAPQSLAVTEPVRWTVSLLESGRHGFWQAAVLLSLLLLLAAAAAALVAGGTPLLSVTVGAGFAAGASLAVWLFATGGSAIMAGPVEKEIMLILRDGAWIGLRNSLAVTVAAGSLLILFRPNRRATESVWPERPSPTDSTV